MTQIHSHSEIIKALQAIHQQISTTIQQVSQTEFFETTVPDWSRADYLKHLILSVKPFARAIEMPLEQLEKLFGITDRASMSYEDLVAKYHSRLDEGVRAEDSPRVIPVNFRIPYDIGDNIQPYLVEQWDKANASLMGTLENWSDEQLNHYTLMHPALGLLTIREMCFFTIYHNQMHYKDILQKI